jgi:hypothetical protein
MSPDDRTDPGVAEAERGANGAPEEVGDPFADLVALLTARFEVLVTSVKTLLAVHTDRAQLAIRRRLQTALLAAVGVFVGATIAIYATVHVVRGTAQGLADLFGRAWLGSLSAGLLFLLLIGGGLFLALRRWDKKELRKAQAKYAEFQQEQSSRIAASEREDASRHAP